MGAFNKTNAKREKVLAIGCAVMSVFTLVAAETAFAEGGRPGSTASSGWVSTTQAAVETAEKIAAAGAPDEVYKHAVHLRDTGDMDHAMGFLRYSSSNGYAPASQLLATIYRQGTSGVRANFRQAERYRALAETQFVN